MGNKELIQAAKCAALVWRAADKSTARGMDIETYGINGYITGVGISKLENGYPDHSFFIRGQDLSRLRIILLMFGAKILLTYNGEEHDISRLLAEYPDVLPKGIIHIDLWKVAKAIFGKAPKLKDLEVILNVDRPEKFKRKIATGAWSDWKRTGNIRYLEKLRDYNSYDTINLFEIADKLFSMVT